MIFGRPGTGKSTLAVRLAKKLSLPVYHADKYFYTSGWQERPRKEFDADICALARQDAYVIDGNCARILLEHDLPVQLVVYLHAPLWLCYWRVIKRWYMPKDITIDDRAPACTERLTWQFLQKIWNHKKSQDPRMQQCYSKYPHTKFVHIANEQELQAFESSLVAV